MGSCLSGYNHPHGSQPSGELSGWELSWCEFVLVRSCPSRELSWWGVAPVGSCLSG